MSITSNTILCTGVYNLSNGISVGSNIVLDCNGSSLNQITGLTGQGITISGQNTTIKNCILNGYSKGIYFISASNITITKNHFSGCYHGINMLSSNNNNISSNLFTENYDIGLYAYHSTGNTVSKNNFSYNGKGIYFDGCSNNEIKNNYFYYNYGGAVYLLSSSNNNYCSENYMYLNGITWGQGGGFSLSSSNYNKILNNNMTNNLNGIRMDYSSYNNASNNIMTSNTVGLYVFGYSSDNYIQYIDQSNKINGKPVLYLLNKKDSTISLSNTGYFSLVNSTNITIKNENLESGYPGINIVLTTNSSIENSYIPTSVSVKYSNGIEIRNDTFGSIYLYYGGNNSLKNNSVSSISIESSQNNLLRKNNITDSIVFTCYYSSDYNNDIDTSNMLKNKPVYYYFGKNNIALNNIDAGMVVIASSSNISLNNVSLVDNNEIGFFYVNFSSISNTNLVGTKKIKVYSSNYNNITENFINISQSNSAITVSSSYSNTIKNNKLVGTADMTSSQGIYFVDSGSNTISNNNISNLLYGIFQMGYYENYIKYNNIINNYYGIYLMGAKSKIEYNNIYSNNINLLLTQYPIDNPSYNPIVDNNWWGSEYCVDIQNNISDYRLYGYNYGIANYSFVLDSYYPSGLSIECINQSGMLLSKGWNLLSLKESVISSKDISIILRKGWNLFGYSSDQVFYWLDAIISSNAENKTVQEAADSNWIQKTIYYYDTNTGSYKLVPGNDNYLRKNKAYWLYSKTDNLTLILPNIKVSMDSSYDLDDINITKDSTTKSLTEAQSSGWIMPNIYYYNQSYKTASNSLRSWIGYWIYSNYNLTFILPQIS
jgi:parallel beta-helix repeat protein